MLFVVAAVILAILGVVALLRGEILWGVLLIVAACAVGPGGWFVFD
jgi:hypothetical protein